MNPTSNFRLTLALIAVLHVAVIAAFILWMKSRMSAGSSAAAPSPNQEPAAAAESPFPTQISPWMDPSAFVAMDDPGDAAEADSLAPGRLPSATWTAPESDPESAIVLPLPASARPAIALNPEPVPAPLPEPEPEPEPPLQQEKPPEAVPKVTRVAPAPAAKETPKKAPDPPQKEKEVPAKRTVPKVTRTAPVAARKAVPVSPTKKAEPAKPKEAPPKVSPTKPADKPVAKTPPKSAPAPAAPAKKVARKATPVSASGAATPGPAAEKTATTAVKSTSGQGAPAGEAAAGNGKSSSASPGGTGSSGDGRGNATEGDFSWYNGIIQSAFHNQWRQPKGIVGGEVLSTRATIRIGRDGSIRSAIISSPSGVREMDASVADALRTVRNITAPPPGIPDADLTVVVRFKLD